jgi:D-beta-D-heptose 7-phosphate kinase/D-beta-D-heptose 1-phosphate adenosyltransferase
VCEQEEEKCRDGDQGVRDPAVAALDGSVTVLGEEGDLDLASFLCRFSTATVAVVGDVIYDAYLDGAVARLSREAPVPVVSIDERREAAGGAANVAVNLAALGSRVRLCSVIGDDDAGMRVLGIAREHGVDVEGVVVSPRRFTCAKRRVLASGQMLVRFDEGTEAPLEPSDESRLSDRLTGGLDGVDAVIVSDYRAGVLSDVLLDRILAAADGVPLIVDARDPRRFRRARPAICTPNFAETAPMLRPQTAPADRVTAVTASSERVLRATGAAVVVVTLDRDGVMVLEHGRAPHHVHGESVVARCSTGAGDTLIAALTLATVGGADAAMAAEIAAAAAAVVVAKPGTATCSPSELRLRLLPGGKVIPDVARLAVEGERHRREGRRIALANGCFDILHRGHVALLNEAKRSADVLFVAVNADESVRRLKGSSRPVNALADRVEVLVALSCVDHVVPFGEDRPTELIRALRPDLLVKGGDYTEETVPEAGLVRDLGGRVLIVPRVPPHSTTRIVDRARAG